MTAAAVEPSTVTNERAADTICRHALDADDARQLLEMCGIVAPGGHHILPDQTGSIRVPTMGRMANTDEPPPLPRDPDEPMARNLTTPPGLRVLPPLPAPRPRQATRPKPKPKAKAGTRTASTPAARATPAAAAPKTRRAVAVCGTTAGHSAHKRKKEPSCQPCKDASAAYQREYALRRGHQPRKPPACGTRAGYQRHSRIGEQPCEPCREASAVHAREVYRRKHPAGSAPARVAVCGTRSAYLRHLRLKEAVCDPCREAENEYHRSRRAAVAPPPPPKPVSAAELLADAQRSPHRAVARTAATGIRLLVQIQAAPPNRVHRLLTQLADALADVSRAQARAASRTNGAT